MERLVQRTRQIFDFLHQIIVFGAWPRDADGVAFLERVVADEVRRHLPGDDDERDRVAQRVGEPGDGVGRARPRRHQHAAHLAGGARIALGGMHRTLLMPHQDVANTVLRLEQRVIDRQYRAAGIAEDVLHALIGERLDHHFRAGHLCHGPLHSLVFHSLIRFGNISVIKKGPQRAPGSRTAKPRGWDYPPPAVRPATTRISKVAKVRTDVPLVRKRRFICIAAAPVKRNAAGIRRRRPGTHFKRSFEIEMDAHNRDR